MPASADSTTSEQAIAAYVAAVRRLLPRAGYERSGDPQAARKFDIDHIRQALDRLGRPDRRHTVHVAGSKGKGSTASMIESILRAAGAHTLLLTSPDVHSARERIQIDGRPLGYEAFAALAERLAVDPDAERWSYFESLTMLGWLAGAEARCDWQVLEVGLGGRLDATNAVESKEVAVITPIDLEHTAILGNTLAEIAGEKAGIISAGCEVVTAPMRSSAIEVIRERARAQGALLHEVPVECAMRSTKQTLDGQDFDLRTPLRTYRRLSLPLVGRHQLENAATAVRAIELAWARAGTQPGAGPPESAVRRGLATVRWPARFEAIRRRDRPLVILDALHTPLAAVRFRDTVRDVRPPRPHVFVLGLLEGRDLPTLASALLEPGDDVVVTLADTPRAADLTEVVAACAAAGALTQRAEGVTDALERAEALAGPRGTVFVVGSLYTASEAREFLLGITGDRALGLR